MSAAETTTIVAPSTKEFPGKGGFLILLLAYLPVFRTSSYQWYPPWYACTGALFFKGRALAYALVLMRIYAMDIDFNQAELCLR